MKNESIPIYKPDDIYKVIEELNKGAEEIGKLTLEEQMERAKKKQKKRADSAVVKQVDTASCLLVASCRRDCVKVRVLPPEPVKERKNYL